LHIQILNFMLHYFADVVEGKVVISDRDGARYFDRYEEGGAIDTIVDLLNIIDPKLKWKDKSGEIRRTDFVIFYEED
jgi:hypothetical protein